jgi:hypothetical protein
MSKLQEKPTALQKLKFINLFLGLWVIFALLDLHPDTDLGTSLNSDPDTDPDPQDCQKEK